MAKINIMLLIALVGCALTVITSQHQARRLYVELEAAASHSRQLEADWNQLRVEQSGLATAAIIDSKARRELGLESPNARQTWHLVVDADSRQAQLTQPQAAPGARPPASPPRPSPKVVDPAPAVSPPQPAPQLRPLAAGDVRPALSEESRLPVPGYARATAGPHDAYPTTVSAPAAGGALGER